MIAIMNMNVIRTTLPYCGCCPPVPGIRLFLLLLYPIGIMSFSSLLSRDVAGTPIFISRRKTFALNVWSTAPVFLAII